MFRKFWNWLTAPVQPAADPVQEVRIPPVLTDVVADDCVPCSPTTSTVVEQYAADPVEKLPEADKETAVMKPPKVSKGPAESKKASAKAPSEQKKAGAKKPPVKKQPKTTKKK
jgi:hypothetical protein